MATAQVVEYADIAMEGGIPVLAADARNNVDGIVEQSTVTYTTATESAAFNVNTKWVWIYASALAHVAFGLTTVVAATVDSHPIPAATGQWFRVTPGDVVDIYDGSS